MKIFLAIVASMLFAIQGAAQEKIEVTGLQQKPFQWVHYLSDVEKADIGRLLAIEEFQQREAAGTLYDNIQGKEISISGSFVPTGSTSAATGRAAAFIPAGNVTCNINPQFPHAGSGPGGSRVVKAKSAGFCNYTHSGPGAAPPTIKWELVQTLIGSAALQIVVLVQKTWVRNGLHPVWSASSSQIFSSSCTNADYFHADLVWVTPPPGWTYIGPNPISFPGVFTPVTNC